MRTRRGLGSFGQAFCLVFSWSKSQVIRALESLRCFSHAAISRSSVGLLGMRRSRRCLCRTPSSISTLLSQLASFGSVVKFQTLRQPARFRCWKGIVQPTDGVNGQIVEHDAKFFGRWEVLIAQLFHAVREVNMGAAVGDFDVPPRSVYVDKCEQFGSSVSPTFVVRARKDSWHCGHAVSCFIDFCVELSSKQITGLSSGGGCVYSICFR